MSKWDSTQADESRGWGSADFGRGYYAISTEGSPESWSTTPSATPADWDQALADARQRATELDHNQVVRVHTREGRRIVATATAEGEIAWPRLASPTMKDDVQVAREREQDLEAEL